MDALSAVDSLRLWEQGTHVPVAGRAMVLAAAAAPELPVAELGRLPIGRRDALLLRMRATTFGGDIAASAQCPACGTSVELATSCEAILAAETEANEPLPVQSNGYAVGWRLPNSLDLAAVAECAGQAEALDLLLSRCLVSVVGPDGPADLASLPQETRSALASAMAEADPCAELLFSLSCPECGAEWSTQLDVPAFVWTELEARAYRLLRAVDVLAARYGWRESDILALGETRRNAYLRLAGHG